jgi:hypothetical protein
VACCDAWLRSADALQTCQDDLARAVLPNATAPRLTHWGGGKQTDYSLYFSRHHLTPAEASWLHVSKRRLCHELSSGPLCLAHALQARQDDLAGAAAPCGVVRVRFINSMRALPLTNATCNKQQAAGSQNNMGKVGTNHLRPLAGSYKYDSSTPCAPPHCPMPPVATSNTQQNKV